jgi:hypothetical protein
VGWVDWSLVNSGEPLAGRKAEYLLLYEKSRVTVLNFINSYHFGNQAKTGMVFMQFLSLHSLHNAL